MLQSDLVDCVIGLGKHLFYNSAMEACILICRKNKPINRRGRVQLIDAKTLVTRSGDERYISDEHLAYIAETYDNYIDVDKICKVVTIDEVKENDYSLTLTKYISGTFDFISEEDDCFDEQILTWNEQRESVTTAYQQLVSMIGGEQSCQS